MIEKAIGELIMLYRSDRSYRLGKIVKVCFIFVFTFFLTGVGRLVSSSEEGCQWELVTLGAQGSRG